MAGLMLKLKALNGNALWVKADEIKLVRYPMPLERKGDYEGTNAVLFIDMSTGCYVQNTVEEIIAALEKL